MRVASLASHGGLPHRKATHYQETVLRIKDGFPKLKDAPGNQEDRASAWTNSAGKVSVWHRFEGKLNLAYEVVQMLLPDAYI